VPHGGNKCNNIGHFARAFTLSRKIDQQQISAQLEDGVLKLTLKKPAEAMPRRIGIS
jgi:HSP20 family protein